jgi:hypothetical protein
MIDVMSRLGNVKEKTAGRCVHLGPTTGIRHCRRRGVRLKADKANRMADERLSRDAVIELEQAGDSKGGGRG